MDPNDIVNLDKLERQLRRLSFEDVMDWVFAWGIKALAGILILVLAWTLSRWVHKTLRRSLSRSRLVDPTLVPLFANIVRYLILAIAIIAVLAQLGVQTTGLIALLGAAGLAIGLAVQGALTNVASGVMLLILRPFRVGELIQTERMTGYVEEIGLFSTTLRGFDFRLLIMPNRTLFESLVENLTRLNVRRVTLDFTLSSHADPHQAVALIAEVAKNHPKALKDPAPFVAHNGLTPQGQLITVYIWMRPNDFGDVQTDVAMAIIAALQKAQLPFVEMPFRTNTTAS